MIMATIASTVWSVQWAVDNPDEWMPPPEQIESMKTFFGSSDMQTIEIAGRTYDLRDGDVDILKLYKLARKEADRMIATGDVTQYKKELTEYNEFFKMIGAEEIPVEEYLKAARERNRAE